MTPRIEKLCLPPKVGRYYLVPTVRFSHWHMLSDWPVMGPEHEDAEHLGFEPRHYHFDIRFLNQRERSYLEGARGLEVAVAGAVLSVSIGSAAVLPAPVWRRRRCRRSTHGYPIALTQAAKNFQKLYSAYAGQYCRSGRSGFICPHRNFRLGSIEAVDGVIVCPLHGLRIDAETGIVLPVPASEIARSGA